MLKVCTINKFDRNLNVGSIQWNDLNITKVVSHLFSYFYVLFFTIRIWIAKLLWPDDQAENSDDHAKLICCNRFREETN